MNKWSRGTRVLPGRVQTALSVNVRFISVEINRGKEKKHLKCGENMKAQRSSVCCCLSHKHLFSGDISEGHSRLMFSLVSVMSKQTHRL